MTYINWGKLKIYFKKNSHRLNCMLDKYRVKDLYTAPMYVYYNSKGAEGDFNEYGYKYVGTYTIPDMGTFDDRIILGDSDHIKNTLMNWFTPLTPKIVSFHSTYKGGRFRYVLYLCK